MEICKAFKFRIYLTSSQLSLIEKTFGCVRFIYNSMLAERKEAYERLKDEPNREALWTYKYKTEKDYKFENAWLSEVDSTSLQQSRIDLSNAYSNFFKSLSGKRKGNSGFPRFHKKGVKESYRSMCVNNNIKVDFDSRKIKLPKIGWVKYRDNRVFDNSLIKQVTVSKSKTGKYFASILVRAKIDDIEKMTYTPEMIINGFDMSLENFYVDANGNSPEYVRRFRNNQNHIAYLQKQVSKKKLGSSNRRKAQMRVNKLHEKIVNSRKDFVEKLSNKVISENDAIVIESLNMRAMAQSLKLGKSVNDLGWGMFVNRIEQKIALTEKILIKADKFFASSQICHICGYQNHDLTLKDREWDCPVCRSHLMRDENAGQNLRQFGINFLTNTRQGLPTEPAEMSSAEESMKQEAFDFSQM